MKTEINDQSDDILGSGFASLSPERVLDAVESLGLPVDGRLLALNSYENRVYQVGLDDGPPIIAKFYRPARWSDEAILEEHAFLAQLHEAEIPAVPANIINGTTLHHCFDLRLALFPRQGGRAPEMDDPQVLEWLGRFLGRIHAVGSTQAFVHRPTLDIASFGIEPRQYLLEHDFIPLSLRSAYESVSSQALEAISAAFARAGDYPVIRLHGDCHGGNVMWTEMRKNSDNTMLGGPHFVDFDDARMGPAIQDLWMLLSGDRADMQRQLCDILAGYEDFAEFHPNQLQLIEALRTLRMLHYSAWLARRWQDPAFPPAFPWFNTERYWQEKILELREQVAIMSEPALIV
ncbi:MAG: serine/threonine protein kinase [Burkholderiales bacterium]|nr:serine/threonine protein kinase [Burkholderiales bacterium]